MTMLNERLIVGHSIFTRAGELMNSTAKPRGLADGVHRRLGGHHRRHLLRFGLHSRVDGRHWVLR